MSHYCGECIDDEYIRGLADLDGGSDPCDLCDSVDNPTLPLGDLLELFRPLVMLYEPIEDFMPTELMKAHAGEHSTLAEKLSYDDWGLFNDPEVARRFLQDCAAYDEDFNPDRLVGVGELFLSGGYEESRRLIWQWNDLKARLTEVNRFFPSPDILEDLAEALRAAKRAIAPGATLHRARICQHGKVFAATEMGAPPAHLATAGRANPSGIPYLYLASSASAAVSEVRPSVGDLVAVGTFTLKRSVKVFDLRSPQIGSPFQWETELATVVQRMGFLAHLGQELSRPVGSLLNEIPYIPTQYLCEFMKREGFNGVMYRSGLAKGYNVALFDPSAAECMSVDSRTIERIEIS